MDDESVNIHAQQITCKQRRRGPSSLVQIPALRSSCRGVRTKPSGYTIQFAGAPISLREGSVGLLL